MFLKASTFNLQPLTIVTCLILSLASCKEQPPIGLILTAPISFTDSSYTVSPVPTAQAHNVFVEEFTGVRCANCPAGAAIIASLQRVNFNRIKVVKMHSNFLASPIKATDNDLRNAQAQEIDLGFGGAPSKPAAIIDRIINTSVTPNSIFFDDRDKWATAINTQLAKPSIVNIDLVKNYDATTDSIQLRASFTFTQAATQAMAFTIYVIENKVATTQDSALANGTPIEIEDYEHEEIMRACITPVITGTAITDTDIVAGKVLVKSTKFALPTNILNKNNIYIIVLIHNANKGEVLQVAQIKVN
jgi:Outer membrane protein Omp28